MAGRLSDRLGRRPVLAVTVLVLLAALLHDALAVSRLTLDKMAGGGIYDHLGGGFSRYSVDERWLVPHFEKMLYDNAEFIALLTLVWQETRDQRLTQMSLGAAQAQGAVE